MDLETLQLRHRKLTMNMTALMALADQEKRPLTDEEEKSFGSWEKDQAGLETQIKKIKSDDGFMQALNELTGEQPGGEQKGSRFVFSRATETKSLGQQFIESDAGKYLRETKGARSGHWRTPAVELKAVLLEDNLPQPQALPGIVPSPTRPIVMSELFASGPTNSNAILFMEETLFTNAAAPVAEGAVKPESTITFVNKTSRVEKIAHWLPVSDEFLEDEPGLRSYIDNRLRLGVLLELDDQLLNGTGVSPELLGLLVRTDLTPALPMGTATGPDAIATQIALVQNASQLAVDGIVLNPTDWLKFGLLKTTTGEYVGSSPFETPVAPTLWGRRVALTTLMPAGTALVGAFRSGGGQLFLRGGLRVEATNAHSDFFIKNLTCVRAEQRTALVLTRPAAFGKVTGLNPPA